MSQEHAVGFFGFHMAKVCDNFKIFLTPKRRKDEGVSHEYV